MRRGSLRPNIHETEDAAKTLAYQYVSWLLFSGRFFQICTVPQLSRLHAGIDGWYLRMRKPGATGRRFIAFCRPVLATPVQIVGL